MLKRRARSQRVGSADDENGEGEGDLEKRRKLRRQKRAVMA